VRKRLGNLGAEVTSNSPAEFSAHIRRELEKWRKVVKAAGLMAQ